MADLPTLLTVTVFALFGGIAVGFIAQPPQEHLASCEAIADVDKTDSQKLDQLLNITRSIAVEIIPPPDFRE